MYCICKPSTTYNSNRRARSNTRSTNGTPSPMLSVPLTCSVSPEFFFWAIPLVNVS